jgi:TPR repeat protein
MFLNGNGVAKDEMKALEWYLKSAEQRNANIQNNLGLIFANGKRVAKDESI